MDSVCRIFVWAWTTFVRRSYAPTNCSRMFLQSAALQVGADFDSGTNIRTVLRFSPNATVFAIDPFAGRLACMILH